MAEIFSGWLTKQGGSIKSWKKRYFVLYAAVGEIPPVLRYFKSPKDKEKKPVGEILLNENSKVKATSVMQFELHMEDRTYFLIGDTAEEVEQWIEALESQINNEELGRLDDAFMLQNHGYLWKQAGVLKRWEVRYCVLNARRICYYKDATMSQPVSAINIKDCTKATMTDETMFMLVEEDKVHYFASDNAEDVDNWVAVLNNAIDFMRMKTGRENTNRPAPPTRSGSRRVEEEEEELADAYARNRSQSSVPLYKARKVPVPNQHAAAAYIYDNESDDSSITSSNNINMEIPHEEVVEVVEEKEEDIPPPPPPPDTPPPEIQPTPIESEPVPIAAVRQPHVDSPQDSPNPPARASSKAPKTNSITGSNLDIAKMFKSFTNALSNSSSSSSRRGVMSDDEDDDAEQIEPQRTTRDADSVYMTNEERPLPPTGKLPEAPTERPKSVRVAVKPMLPSSPPPARLTDRHALAQQHTIPHEVEKVPPPRPGRPAPSMKTTVLPPPPPPPPPPAAAAASSTVSIENEPDVPSRSDSMDSVNEINPAPKPPRSRQNKSTNDKSINDSSSELSAVTSNEDISKPAIAGVEAINTAVDSPVPPSRRMPAPAPPKPSTAEPLPSTETQPAISPPLASLPPIKPKAPPVPTVAEPSVERPFSPPPVKPKILPPPAEPVPLTSTQNTAAVPIELERSLSPPPLPKPKLIATPPAATAAAVVASVPRVSAASTNSSSVSSSPASSPSSSPVPSETPGLPRFHKPLPPSKLKRGASDNALETEEVKEAPQSTKPAIPAKPQVLVQKAVVAPATDEIAKPAEEEPVEEEIQPQEEKEEEQDTFLNDNNQQSAENESVEPAPSEISITKPPKPALPPKPKVIPQLRTVS